MKNQDFCFFSFFGLSTVLYFIEADIWLNPKGLSLVVDFPLGLAVDTLTVFRMMVLATFYFFRHKSIFNWTSGSNITMPYLRRLC